MASTQAASCLIIFKSSKVMCVSLALPLPKSSRFLPVSLKYPLCWGQKIKPYPACLLALNGPDTKEIFSPWLSLQATYGSLFAKRILCLAGSLGAIRWQHPISSLFQEVFSDGKGEKGPCEACKPIPWSWVNKESSVGSGPWGTVEMPLQRKGKLKSSSFS